MERHVKQFNQHAKLPIHQTIYWHRTTLVRSLNGKPMELITVTSQEGVAQNQRERVWNHPTFANAKEGVLFPEGPCDAAV